ncbi:hypothetical protein Ahia01_000972400, partial [Argonauta hians]
NICIEAAKLMMVNKKRKPPPSLKAASSLGKQSKIEHFFTKSSEPYRKDATNAGTIPRQSSESPNPLKRKRSGTEESESCPTARKSPTIKDGATNSRTYQKNRLSRKKRKTRIKEKEEEEEEEDIEIIDLAGSEEDKGSIHPPDTNDKTKHSTLVSSTHSEVLSHFGERDTEKPKSSGYLEVTPLTPPTSQPTLPVDIKAKTELLDCNVDDDDDDETKLQSVLVSDNVPSLSDINDYDTSVIHTDSNSTVTDTNCNTSVIHTAVTPTDCNSTVTDTNCNTSVIHTAVTPTDCNSTVTDTNCNTSVIHTAVTPTDCNSTVTDTNCNTSVIHTAVTPTDCNSTVTDTNCNTSVIHTAVTPTDCNSTVTDTNCNVFVTDTNCNASAIHTAVTPTGCATVKESDSGLGEPEADHDGSGDSKLTKGGGKSLRNGPKLGRKTQRPLQQQQQSQKQSQQHKPPQQPQQHDSQQNIPLPSLQQPQQHDSQQNIPLPPLTQSQQDIPLPTLQQPQQHDSQQNIPLPPLTQSQQDIPLPTLQQPQQHDSQQNIPLPPLTESQQDIPPPQQQPQQDIPLPLPQHVPLSSRAELPVTENLTDFINDCKSDEFLDEGPTPLGNHGDEGEEANEGDPDSDGKFRVPYYLENFLTMLTQVLQDDHYKSLFNADDMKVVDKFHKLSEISQKLYVRMFSRKLMWRMQSKIKYPEIAEDLSEFIGELIGAGLAYSEEDLTQLEETLNLLSAVDLRSVAKSFYHNCTNQTKVQIVALLLKHCRQKSVRSLFEPNGTKTAEKSMISRAKRLLGPCFKLVESHRMVFVRMLNLFSLCVSSVEDDTGGAISAQLFQMLQVNLGRVVFPPYQIQRSTKIFQSRSDLIRYCDAIQLDSEMVARMEKKDLPGAYQVFLQARTLYEENKKDKRIRRLDKKLPPFLRHCTAGYVYCHLLFQGVEVLQKQRNYKQAVEVLEELLAQEVYACTHRGRWYDRLALNLEQHLRSPSKALDVIERSLKDSWVSVGHRYSLYLRAEKLCKDPKSKWHNRLNTLNHETVIEAPKVTITGRTLDCGLPGVKYRFITDNPDTIEGSSADDVVVCPVEVLVLNHYKNNGYPQGIHAEGSVVHLLFTLLFFDILYMDLPDVFISPYQTSPLDLSSHLFYTNRKEAIDVRLQYIANAPTQTLNDDISEVWEAHYGSVVAGGQWDMFKSITHLQGLVSCMEGDILAGILGRYAKNPRHTRSGFPDLTLWNVTTKKFKICEVKGPGDRLSTKQMLWLDHLIRLGVDAEVCHITPVGTKKLLPTTK